MVHSMTGYGNSTTQLGPLNLTVEIKTLNSRGLDVNIRSSFIPREKELLVKKLLGERLLRGSIDLYVTSEMTESSEARKFNQPQIEYYLKELESISTQFNIPLESQDALASALRLPDSTEVANSRQEVEKIVEESWDAIYKTIEDALEEVVKFRVAEGERLKEELLERTEAILEALNEVAKLEPARGERVREKLMQKIEELIPSPDLNRFEQEIIYYIERLDVREEMVRLEQHCNYFIETLESDPQPGKKLGFIGQEMGREINTLGSKANDAEIQKIVVEMKEQLDKIREQSLNLV